MSDEGDRELTMDEAIALLNEAPTPEEDLDLPQGPLTAETAVEVLRRVAELEQAVARAWLMEPDHEAYRAKSHELGRCANFAGFGAGSYRAPDDPLPSEEDALERLRTQHVRRLLLRVEESEDERWGSVYAGTLTSTFALGADPTPDAVPSVRWIVGTTPAGPRIIAAEAACVRCDPDDPGAECPRCAGRGWTPMGGPTLTLADPKTVWRR